jgi:RNA polymerase sigma factor (sigma-70 family)
LPADVAQGGDQQLLERFVAQRDDSAFAGLVQRHGRSVWGVCRRVLGREQDAEDAFQAVFLVLARKAGSICRGEAVGSWLYGVAYRLAIRAKQNAARRRQREQSQPVTREELSPSGEAACRELQRILDEEVQRLQEKYRAPFVLCCLEGMSRAEAASALCWKEGTVASRLARARQLLQSRLARRGFTLSAALTALALANPTSGAAVPASLVQTTARAVLAPLSVRPVALAEDYLRQQWLGQLGLGLGWLLAVALLITAAGVALTLGLAGSANEVAIVEPESFVPPGVALGTHIGEQVLAVALAPDARRLVTAGAWSDLPGQLKIWDVETGAETAAITRIPGVRAAALSPDCGALATGDWSGAITLRAPDTGQERISVHAHDGGVASVAYSSDGELLASAGLDRTVKIWSTPDLRAKQTLAGHTDRVATVAFFRHRHAVVTGSWDRTARLWDLTTGKATWKLEGFRSAVEAVAISPDDGLVAAASSEPTVKLWDATTGAELAVLEGDQGQAFLSVAFSPDGALLAAGGRDGTIRLWDVKTRRSVGTLEKHEGPVWALAFARGNVLASGSADRTAKIWRLGNGKQPRTLTTTWSGIQPIRAAVYSPDGKVLAVATTDRTVHMRDAGSGDILSVLRGHTRPVNCLAFSPDGMTLASGSDDATVKCWNWPAGEETRTLTGHAGPVDALAFTPDGQQLASGGDDATLRIWDTATGKERIALPGPPGAIRALAVAPDGQTLASGGAGQAVTIWDLATQQEARSLKGHRGVVRALAFARDGGLASAGDDATVKVWDPRTGAERLTLKGHAEPVLALAFSAGGQTLVSAGRDRTVRVWDAVTGQPRAILMGHKEAVTALTIHPHGQDLVSGSHDTLLLRWRAGAAGAGLDPPPAPDAPPGAGNPVVHQDPVRKDEPAPKEKPAEYHQSLKGKLAPDAGLRLFGPNAEKYVHFEPDGLRLTMPAGQAKGQTVAGLASGFGMHGDFEITLRYEVLQAPDGADAGDNGTRFTLGIVLNKADKNLANFSWKMDAKTGSHHVAWSNANGKDKPSSKYVVTKAKSGRLRLARAANTLSFSVAEGDDQDFKLSQQFPADTEDVREFRITTNTGSDKAAIDVRVTDLSIRAARFLKTPGEIPLLPAPPPRELAERVVFPFRDGLDKQPMLRLVGPEVGSMAKVDDQGLRFTLPADRLSGAAVSIESRLRLRGDFEITLAYELLAVPNPAPELGAGLVMRVDFDTPNAFQAVFSRTQKPSGPASGANYTTTGPDGKEDFKGLTVCPVKAPKGRLRLVRTGSKLIYQIADGDAGFHVLATKEFGTADVMAVRAQCITGWKANFAVDIRFGSLELRADKIETPTPRVLPEHVEVRFADGIEKFPHLRLIGPDVAQMVRTDGQGIRFKVPAERLSSQPVGVESRVRLGGDFEITLAYDLLDLPDPPPKLGAGVDLRVVFDTADAFQAHIGRVKNAKGNVIGANYITTGPDGKEAFKGITVQRTQEPRGRLRLVRTGKKLFYQFADGAGDFQELATREFGTADVIAVRADCTTGWQTQSGVEVRFSNLDLRSEQMPNKDAPTAQPPPQQAADEPDAVPPDGKSRTWLIVGGLLLGLLSLFLVGSILAYYLLVRGRAVKASPPQASSPAAKVEPAAGAVFVVCQACGKKLKIKAELAGKRVKCPECGHMLNQA